MPNIIKGHPINSNRAKSYGNNYIEFYSLKNHSIIKCESELEFSGFMHFEFSPDVRRYTDHPGKSFEIDGSINSVKRIFDGLVTYKDGTQKLIEFKYQSDIDKKSGSERSLRQIEEQKRFCETIGIGYEMITDEFLYVFMGRHYINNCLFIVQRMVTVRYLIAKEQGRKILKMIENMDGHITLRDIKNQGVETENLFDGICYLLYTGQISADLGTEELSYDTEVTVNE